jgi:hypothetical protein
MKYIGLFVIILSVAHLSSASQPEPVSVSKIIDLSKRAPFTVPASFGTANLFMIEGVLNSPPPCDSVYHWYFRYLNTDTKTSGAVEFVPSGKDCGLTRKWTLDSVALGLGYYFFDISDLVYSPIQSASAALAAHPQFAWNGYVQIYRPMNPIFMHALYFLAGKNAGPNGGYVVDATTNQVADE